MSKDAAALVAYAGLFVGVAAWAGVLIRATLVWRRMAGWQGHGDPDIYRAENARFRKLLLLALVTFPVLLVLMAVAAR